MTHASTCICGRLYKETPPGEPILMVNEESLENEELLVYKRIVNVEASLRYLLGSDDYCPVAVCEVIHE